MKQPSPVAREYAQQHAAKLFAGRKGHGRSAAASRLLRRAELVSQLARAFDVGAQFGQAVAEVKP